VKKYTVSNGIIEKDGQHYMKCGKHLYKVRIEEINGSNTKGKIGSSGIQAGPGVQDDPRGDSQGLWHNPRGQQKDAKQPKQGDPYCA
jgi:hypothetical protein